jgi:membrane-associated phospholipid phosphatase
MGLVNIWWKISHHATAILGGVLLADVIFGDRVGLLLAPLVVLVCVARVYLRKHTPAQIAAGLLLAAGTLWGLLAAGCFGG